MIVLTERFFTIIVVGGIKGGFGKTTIATNLAVMNALMGKMDVLLVDADEQESASDFSLVRSERQEQEGFDQDEHVGRITCIKLTGRSVKSEVEKQATKYNQVIIDTGGRDTSSQRAALSIADCMIIPFIPRSFDIWTVSSVSSVIDDIKTVNPNLKIYSFLNRADPRGLDNEDAKNFLKENKSMDFLEDVVIQNRKSFSSAAAFGMSVVEYKPKDKNAIKEIESLYYKIADFEMQMLESAFK